MWWHRRFILDCLLLAGLYLLVGLHLAALLTGAWFGVYFLWLLFDTSVYLFLGFVCLCYLGITCYFYAFDHDPTSRTL
jgi:hypothetical protein